MKREKGYVLDSFALLAYFQAEEGSKRVKEILENALIGKTAVHLSAVNLGEIYYISSRKLGNTQAEEILNDIMRLPITIQDATLERILNASRIKARHPISYADTFAVSLGIELGMPIATGDPEFKKVEHLVKINWL